MVFYLIECESCDLSWEVNKPMSKPPKKSKCPECGKMGERVFTSAATHFKGYGWETNISKSEKRVVKGMDKSTADQFLNDSCKNSRDRVNKSKSTDYYQPMKPTEEGLKILGAKALSPEKRKENIKAKKEGAKKIVSHINTKNIKNSKK